MFYRNYVSHVCVSKHVVQLDTFALKIFPLRCSTNQLLRQPDILHFLRARFDHHWSHFPITLFIFFLFFIISFFLYFLSQLFFPPLF